MKDELDLDIKCYCSALHPQSVEFDQGGSHTKRSLRQPGVRSMLVIALLYLIFLNPSQGVTVRLYSIILIYFVT